MLLLTLTGFGMLVSGYLISIHWFPSTTFCSGVGDCEAVNASQYATIGDIPIAVLGFGMYAGIFLLTSMRNRFQPDTIEKTHLAVFGLSLIGVLFSAYLTYVELYVIHAICPWCVASAVIVTLIFFISLRDLFAWLNK